ncbi:MAG: hypothetical protein H6732_07220 [Alphaproteobacteria bacterium]|nr:hypothetical protein [Alphaproteobacteria bacterium]
MRVLAWGLVWAGCAEPEVGPVLAEVRIEPAEPTAEDALRVVLDDLEGEPLAPSAVDARFSWTVDGLAVRDLTGPQVPEDRTAKGQQWAVEVAVDAGLTVLAASTEVRNTAPTTFVVVSEAGAFRPLTVDVLVDDLDGDEVTWEGGWLLDGIPFDEVTDDTIPAGYLLRDQVWTYAVDATDGDTQVHGRGEATIGNTPPEILSVAVRPEAPRAGQRITAAVVSVDADGDVVTETQQWTVDGETVADPGRWGLRGVAGQELEVRVEVDDGHGGRASWVSEPIVVAP